MKAKLMAMMRWYFLPGVEMALEARRSGIATRGLPMRAVVIQALPRVLVVVVFVWSVAETSWYIAGVLGVTIVTLGLLRWGLTRWVMQRVGGTHG